jgi:uncharacterized delta-60 repeat protein
MQPDDKLLLTRGRSIIRFTSQGTLDGSFGRGGTIDLGKDTLALAVQPGGKIVVSSSDGTVCSISRFQPDGTPDASFATGGSITMINQRFRDEPALALAIQPNGKILAGGSVNGDATISRYALDGTLDATFGTNGIAVTAFTPLRSQIKELIFQPDNKLVAAGTVEVGSYYTSNPVILRYDLSAAAAGLTVSGRVTTPDGLGLRNASVTLTDSVGRVRTATTSSFGYYTLTNVELGAYTVSVSSRRYRFASRSLQLGSNLVDVDFVGLQ